MKKEHWEEQEIEQLLSQMPKIKDERPKEQLLQKLIEAGAFEENVEKHKEPIVVKKKRSNWTPFIASIASLFIIALLTANYINNNRSFEENATVSNDIVEESTALQDNVASTPEMEQNEAATFTIEGARTVDFDMRTALYEDRLQGFTAFTIGASNSVESIPLSILVPNETIEEMFENRTPTTLQLYESFAPKINTQLIGFDAYEPYVGELNEDGRVITHVLPETQNYDAGTASLGYYIHSLYQTFKQSYDQVKIVDETGNGYVFSEVVEPMEPLQLNGLLSQTSYYRFALSNGTSFLSPYSGEPYDTVEQALEAMKQSKSDFYTSVILPDVDFTVQVEGETAVVTFENELDLEQFDPVAVYEMIEAMLLTAANFDKEILFSNILQIDWGTFDFTKPLPKPLGANVIYIDQLMES
jgi:hypothetical protein